MKSTIHLPTLAFALATAIILTGCADYLATSPAVGYRTGENFQEVPPAARTETIGGTRYFNHEGTYYRPRQGYYTVVDPVY